MINPPTSTVTGTHQCGSRSMTAHHRCAWFSCLLCMTLFAMMPDILRLFVGSQKGINAVPFVGLSGGSLQKQQIFVHEIGGMEDHLPMLIEIPLTLSFSDAMQEIKNSSSRWMGRNFAWQRRFGVFGVSASNLDAVIRYIRTQEAHHRKMTFEEEFIALLQKTRRAIRSAICIRLKSCVAPLALDRLSLLLPTAFHPPRETRGGDPGCRGLPCGRA